MEVVYLRTFVEVAEALSFTQAATRLRYAQSTVSAHILILERDLGVKLIDRLGRRIRLTTAGEALLREAKELIAHMSAVERAIRVAAGADDVVAGRVVAAAPETLLSYRLPSLIGRYHRDFPAVNLSLRPVAGGRLRGDAERALIDGVIDIAFVLDEQHLRSRGGVRTEALWPEPISIVAAPGHPLIAAGAMESSEIARTTVLLCEEAEVGCVYRTQFLDQLHAAGLHPREMLEFTSVEAVKQCVATGMGISAIPTIAVEADLKHGTLTALEWGNFAVFTYMAWNPRAWQPPAVRSLLELAREFSGPIADSPGELTTG
jgi:DNA-binding transcriptional LysR family regulator